MSNYQPGSVQCPHCREVCPREECEIITHTAVQQWDLLLDISRQWAAVDVGEMDIGDDDDDDEDGSMDDGSVATTKRSVKPLQEILLLNGLQPLLTRNSWRASDSWSRDLYCVYPTQRHRTSCLQELTFSLEA